MFYWHEVFHVAATKDRGLYNGRNILSLAFAFSLFLTKETRRKINSSSSSSSNSSQMKRIFQQIEVKLIEPGRAGAGGGGNTGCLGDGSARP